MLRPAVNRSFNNDKSQPLAVSPRDQMDGQVKLKRAARWWRGQVGFESSRIVTWMSSRWQLQLAQDRGHDGGSGGAEMGGKG